ncbi:MAG TPA: 1,4-dihydroxy-2-naphthoate octaprenyltransferase, partial [Marmoricola sp.]|nr:1,4-dihydroxy-2-naphthoate octaprenyltransferase [Marmoricola sp.]
ILAAWYYTGGSKPYGYLGLGEVMVFIFFGLVAVMGTTFVQTRSVSLASLYAAIGIGALACAILVANNLRDIPTDIQAGKRTLAVVLGDQRTRYFFVLLLGLAVVALVGVALVTSELVLLTLALVAIPMAATTRTVLSGAGGPGLIPVLKQTGTIELLYGLGILIGCSLSHWPLG